METLLSQVQKLEEEKTRAEELQELKKEQYESKLKLIEVQNKREQQMRERSE